jgi:phospholipase/carboxylesterase
VEAISLAKRRFCIHSDRVFLVGFDVGGTMALRVALQSPELFAGVASLGGPLPTGNCPLRNINSVRELPFLLAAARKSKQYSDKQVCADLRLLHSAGAMVSLRQYPGADDLTTQMLADLDRWIMELVGQSSAAIVH